MSRAGFLGRLARRYAARHKGQTVRAVLGLLVATTVLATGLGLGETIAFSIEQEALKRYGPIEVVVRGAEPFPDALVASLNAAPDVRAQGARGAASLHVTGAAHNERSGLAEAFASIRGVPPGERDALGPLRDDRGGQIPEPRAGETVLGAELARRLDARVGDVVRLRASPPGFPGDLEPEPTILVGVGGVPDALAQRHALDVGPSALALVVEVSWQGDAGDVSVEATSPSGIPWANASATSPAQLIVEAPEEGAWSVVVRAPQPTAYTGGAVVIYLPASLDALTTTIEARVIGIAAEEGRAAATGRPTALLPLAELQGALDSQGNATLAYFAVSGDPREAARAIEARLPAGDEGSFEVAAEKQDLIDEAVEAGAEVTGFLLVMGAFTLLAAILLAFTLFSALVEERRGELGIMRALGLTRGEVALSMTLEGALYAAIAAAAGLALGVGLLGLLVALLDALVTGAGGPSFTFHVSPTTLILSFALGTLLPLATIGIASLRFARLDPARAIRNVPDDPRGSRRTGRVFGAIVLLAGALLSFTDLSRLVGLPLALAGVATLLWSAGFPRIALAAAVGAVGLVAWTLYTFDAFPDEGTEWDPIRTLSRGAILALGLAALAVASPKPYAATGRLVGRDASRARSSFVALRYLVARRRPAGLTMAMIAVVVVIVTVMGTLFVVFSGSIPESEAGYSVLGESPLPVEGFPRALPSDIAGAVERADFLPAHSEFRPIEITRDGEPVGGELRRGGASFLGVTDEFAQANEYELRWRAEDYATDRDAWLGVARGEAFLVPYWMVEVLELETGATYNVRTASGMERDVVLAGGIQSQFTFQIFITADDVRQMGFPQGSQVFVRVQDGADPDTVAHRLTALYAEDGVTFTSIPEEVQRISAGIQALVAVFESFLALGLFVGLAATGFLASRAVHERMRDIGTLRALGFEEKHVRGAFMLESTLTAGIGLLIGTAVGLLVAHSIWWRNVRGDGVEFRPPWLILVGFAVTVLLLAAFAANGPAKRASRLPPAIAVRHVE